MSKPMDTTKWTKPEINMGATVIFYTDRSAATIVEVVTQTHIVIQFDTAERTDKNGLSEDQTWACTPNPKADRIHVRLTKSRGWRISQKQIYDGLLVAVGSRNHYLDPSF